VRRHPHVIRGTVQPSPMQQLLTYIIKPNLVGDSYVRLLTSLKTPLLLAHANVWNETQNILYCYNTQIKNFTASSGALQFCIDNAFRRPIPERILIAMVKNSAFVVSANTNPFHSHHYDMINNVMYVNGFQHPSQPLTMDCSSLWSHQG